jgi:hypothetical protein
MSSWPLEGLLSCYHRVALCRLSIPCLRPSAKHSQYLLKVAGTSTALPRTAVNPAVIPICFASLYFNSFERNFLETGVFEIDRNRPAWIIQGGNMDAPFMLPLPIAVSCIKYFESRQNAFRVHDSVTTSCRRITMNNTVAAQIAG